MKNQTDWETQGVINGGQGQLHFCKEKLAFEHETRFLRQSCQARGVVCNHQAHQRFAE